VGKYVECRFVGKYFQFVIFY